MGLISYLALMKVVLLVGGKGSRFGKTTKDTPKPLLTIGGKPILWHLMMIYSHYGYNDFILALGYKAEAFKSYFGKDENGFVNEEIPGHWKVSWVDSGEETDTGGRIKSVAPLLDDDCFHLSWGDILSDINLNELEVFHRAHKKKSTVTAIPFRSKFGHLDLKDDSVISFKEKPLLPDFWINGAFFVLEVSALDYIAGNLTRWEKEPMESLASNGELMAFRHRGFWQCMDTPQERALLEDLWDNDTAPWKIWN